MSTLKGKVGDKLRITVDTCGAPVGTIVTVTGYLHLGNLSYYTYELNGRDEFVCCDSTAELVD